MATPHLVEKEQGEPAIPKNDATCHLSTEGENSDAVGPPAHRYAAVRPPKIAFGHLSARAPVFSFQNSPFPALSPRPKAPFLSNGRELDFWYMDCIMQLLETEGARPAFRTAEFILGTLIEGGQSLSLIACLPVRLRADGDCNGVWCLPNLKTEDGSGGKPTYPMPKDNRARVGSPNTIIVRGMGCALMASTVMPIQAGVTLSSTTLVGVLPAHTVLLRHAVSPLASTTVS